MSALVLLTLCFFSMVSAPSGADAAACLRPKVWLRSEERPRTFADAHGVYRFMEDAGSWIVEKSITVLFLCAYSCLVLCYCASDSREKHVYVFMCLTQCERVIRRGKRRLDLEAPKGVDGNNSSRVFLKL